LKPDKTTSDEELQREYDLLLEQEDLGIEPFVESHITYANDIIPRPDELDIKEWTFEPQEKTKNKPEIVVVDNPELLTIFTKETTLNILDKLASEIHTELFDNLGSARHHKKYEGLCARIQPIKEYFPKLSGLLMGKALETEYLMDHVQKSLRIFMERGDVHAYSDLAFDPTVAIYDHYKMDAFQTILYAYSLKSTELCPFNHTIH